MRLPRPVPARSPRRFLPRPELLEARRLLTDGPLDTSFDGDGRVTVNFGDILDEGGSYAHGRGVAVQPDGKIVVVGHSGTGSEELLISRLSRDGSPDSSFGSGGKLGIVVAAGATYQAAGVVIQPDAKIVIAGTVGGKGGGDIAIVRLNPDGTLDASFGGDGIAIIDSGTGSIDPASSSDVVDAAAVALQADGKIVVAGSDISASADFYVFRVNSDGTPDASFDGDGMRTVAFDRVEDGEDVLHGIAIQPDGKILLAGSASVKGFVGLATDADVAVARLNRDGTLDTSFDGDGEQTIGIDTEGGSSDIAYAVTVQADGKVVLAGSSTGLEGSFMAVRLDPNGGIDTAFGLGGWKNVDFGTINGARASAVAIQRDGKIVLAGTAYTGFFGVADFAVARLTTAGDPDVAFDGDGKRTVDFNEEDDGTSMVLQVDGKIVVAGNTREPSSEIDFAVTRLLVPSTSMPTEPPASPPSGPPASPPPTGRPPTGRPPTGGLPTGTPGVTVTLPPPGTVWYVGGTPPRILGLMRQAGARLGFSIAFSEPMDPAWASVPRMYRLRVAGRDQRFGTRDDRDMRIVTASYDPLARSVFLRAAGRIGLAQPVQLLVNGGVRSTSGVLLDGNGDGWAGDRFAGMV